MIKVGIVGCGAIGSYLVRSICKRYKGKIDLVGVCDIEKSKIVKLNRSLKKKIIYCPLKTLVKRSDLVIEAANGITAAEVIKEALVCGADVMIMSVGGILLNPGLLKKIEKKKIKLYVPSGAISGLDALKAAKAGRITSVKITTRKPIDGLIGAPYLKKKNIDLTTIKTERVIFRGSALEAVADFPQNINVAAILSLAGIGPKKTRVEIVASRKTKRNIHTIEIKGDFGTILNCTENLPSKVNPKTSMLAMLSAIGTLDSILSNVKIGT
ncbi:MAG: aspartate dehydrogenase domain-containing protein [Candidatus Omnitrophota bacterium]